MHGTRESFLQLAGLKIQILQALPKSKVYHTGKRSSVIVLLIVSGLLDQAGNFMRKKKITNLLKDLQVYKV